MKLNYKRTILVGLAFMTISAFWQVYETIVPLILKETFAVSDTFSGVVMALDNVLALFMLPLFGSISDRTNTKIGRRMPFIIFGTVTSAIIAIIIPIMANIRSFPGFMTALMLVLLCMATYRSPAVALMPDVTIKPLRSKANAVINLMGSAGGIFSLLAISTIVPDGVSPNYLPLFIVLAVVMIGGLIVLLITTNEPKLAKEAQQKSKELGITEEEEKVEISRKMSSAEKRSLVFLLMSVFLWFFGYNAITSAFSRYCRVYWQFEGTLFSYTLIVAQAAAIISYIPAGIVASKIGRKKTILFGIVMLTSAFAIAATFKQFSALVLVLFAMAGIGWASINVNSYPMVVEMSRGADVGKYTGYYYTFSMCSQVLTPIVSGAMLEHVGYYTLFPYGAIFAALSFVTMLFVRHGDSKPDKTKPNLEAFDN